MKSTSGGRKMNRDTMKRVFIIRNNMANREIYSNASESFEKKGKGEYYVRGKNKESLNRVAKKGDRGLVLLLTYNADDPTKILDIFIGDDAEMISDEPKYRKEIKRICYREGQVVTRASKPEEKSNYCLLYTSPSPRD